MASGPITSWQIDGKTMETVTDFIFLGSKITANSDCSHEIKRRLLLGRKAMINLEGILKSRDLTLPTKVHLVKAMVFPVVLYTGESGTIKKAKHQRIAFWTVVLEKTLESPLGFKEIKPVNPKGHQSWIYIGRIEAEAEAPILWPPVSKSRLIWKDPDACKDWRREEKETTEDEMVGWRHWLNGHEFEQTPGVGKGQGKPGVLQSRGSQRVGHDWVTEQQSNKLRTVQQRWRCDECSHTLMIGNFLESN